MRIDDRDAVVEINRRGDELDLAIDGRPLPAELLGACRGEIELQLDGRRMRAFVADAGATVAGDARHVFLDGRVLTVRLPSADDDVDEAEAGGGPKLVAEMPGKVVKVLVAEGDEVVVGQALIILESMKMETELAAAVAGTVAAIHVEAGRTVGQGDPLIDVDPA